MEWVEGAPSSYSNAAATQFLLRPDFLIEGQPILLNKPDVEVGACAACSASRTKLMKCSRCNRVKYCDDACQRAHWPIHKKTCGP